MKNLKLNILEQNNLSQQEMHSILGGYEVGWCGCSCYYADNKGSSTKDNGSANHLQHTTSTQGGNNYQIAYIK